MRGIIAALLIAVFAAGCATTTRTETRKVYAPASTVKAGDEVLVLTRSGQKLAFTVTAADERTIQGEGISVQRAQIASLKVLTGTKTVRTVENSAAPAVEAVSTLAIVWGVVCVVAILAIF